MNRLTLGSSEEGHEAEPNTMTGCTGSTYLELTGTLLERDPERIKRKVQQAINRRYNIMGYITFANYIDNLLQGIDVTLSGEERAAKMRDVLRRHFSNKIIIIDEAHNLRDVVGEVLVGTGPGGGTKRRRPRRGSNSPAVSRWFWTPPRARNSSFSRPLPCTITTSKSYRS